jgi:hypothetical protein
MACLTALTAADNCASSDGGIYESFLVECDEITDVTFGAEGEITNFTMATVGAWLRYQYDDDDSAYYNQTSTRTNRKVTIAGESSIKYSGVTQEIVNFANGSKDCCCIVAVHFFNSGQAVVQGIEYNATADTWRFPKRKPRMTPSLASNTGADEDNATFLLQHEGGEFSPTTTLTATDLLAL